MKLLTKRIYRFGFDTAEGNGSMRAELGGKGAGLAEMARLSIPVPPGFTISTSVCRGFLQNGSTPADLDPELRAALQWLEGAHQRNFDDRHNPLLVSVRSGAAVSMPGMMDTVLNVGLNAHNLEGLAAQGGSLRFALDSYRRLLQMFGSVVLDVPKKSFDLLLEEAKAEQGVALDSELHEKSLQKINDSYLCLIHTHTGKPFPQDPYVQLTLAIEAVFQSWKSSRAQHYRRLHDIPDTSGTAVTVQAMVFGNRGAKSGTGVGFTRNPSTGSNEIFGEFLSDAQGEDIVAGIRTPMSIEDLAHKMPSVHQDLCSVTRRLERHFGDAQDFEFTIEDGKLFLLQTRAAKRSALAAVRIAISLAKEGIISREEAITRIDASKLGDILCPQVDFHAGPVAAIAQGLPASPGAAVGTIVFTADDAVRKSGENPHIPLILVRQETTAEDIHGMAVAAGFLTAHGGATSHAAVVARGLGKCCVTGAKGICVDESNRTLQIGETVFHEGDWLTLDGSTGNIYKGELPTRKADVGHTELETLLDWSSEISSNVVRANADTPLDAAQARKAGARGIGLCRTEHMFFAPERLPLMRAMIVASSSEERRRALDLLLPMQQRDFEELFREMSPFPVTIRLLDPPLHEFLPQLDELDRLLQAATETEKADEIRTLQTRVRSLSETNPMMGHRGCRVSITYPEVLEMQVKAILQAALAVTEQGYHPLPEIMLPLVACANEVKYLKRKIEETAAEVFASWGATITYSFGTMIELPRAAVCASSFAEDVSFVSFGTNDLTQMTYGFSRDDARKYLDSYLQEGILLADPFMTIDQEGVGYLIKVAIQQLRAKNPRIKIGVCGEHGGDPASIAYFHSLGVDYVSCSPARLATARLASAQAHLLSLPHAEPESEKKLAMA